MVGTTPKRKTTSAALTAAGPRLALVRDAMAAGVSLTSAVLAQGLPGFSVDRWLRWVDPPDHAELLAEIRDLHARRKLRPKTDGKLLQESERRRQAQAARVSDMNQGDEVPTDALTYREAGALVGRSKETVKAWVAKKKLRGFYRMNGQSGIESVVSRAAVEQVLNRGANTADRGLRNRGLATERILPKAPAFFAHIRSGHSVAHAAKTAGFSATTIRYWRATTDESANTEIGEFLRTWRAATELALRRKTGAAVPKGRSALVYFIGPEDGPGCIKIGRTNRRVEERFRDIQCGSPIRLKVLLTVIAPPAFEAWLHHQFKEDSSHGEWFHPTPRLLLFISGLRKYPDLRGVSPQRIEALSRAARANPLLPEGLRGEA